MAYRTKKQAGGVDANGNALLGLKITGPAEIAINNTDKKFWKLIDDVRGGGKATNNGVYTINGKKCYHTKAGDQVYAVAWWKDPSFVYVEALIEHYGNNNQYRIV
jgi:hypothetical protein